MPRPLESCSGLGMHFAHRVAKTEYWRLVEAVIVLD